MPVGIECRAGLMQEVTCFHCRTVVQIAPDDDHCSNCGEDLRGLLDAQHVSDFFCARIAELNAAGRPIDALAEAERGLSYHNMAELHLLAAMLAEQIGRYDLMRSHVAAIPLDDSLRPEAEWLLRSHQERQRALREGARHGRHGRPVAPPSPGSAFLADVLGTPAEEVRSQRISTRMWMGAAAVLMVTLLLMTLFTRDQRTGSVVSQPVAPDHAVADEALPGQPVEAVLSEGQDGAQTAPASSEPAPGTIPTVQPAPTERLLPIPTPSVPEDLVLPASPGEAIVDSNPRSVVVLSADGFDLARVLRDRGFPELAELPIDARLQDGKLVLNGIVHLDLQRRQILEALETVPGIAEVSAANLLLRPKPTYTVQPGDTLWSIVYDIYGDVDRMEEFSLANVDQVPSPDAIRVGDELRVPPLE